MRVACIVIVLVLGLGVQASTQSVPMLPGDGGDLSTLASAKLDGLVKGGEACGPYFAFSGVPADPTKVGLVTFVFFKDATQEKPVKDIAILQMGSDKIEVHVIAGKKIPAVRVLRSGGPIYPWLEITISPEDFKRAPCLAHSRLTV